MLTLDVPSPSADAVDCQCLTLSRFCVVICLAIGAFFLCTAVRYSFFNAHGERMVELRIQEVTETARREAEKSWRVDQEVERRKSVLRERGYLTEGRIDRQPAPRA